MHRRFLTAYPLLFVLLGFSARDLVGSSDSSFSFVDVTAQAGIRFLQRKAMMDVDNDIDLDLLVANGHIRGTQLGPILKPAANQSGSTPMDTSVQ